MNGIYNDSMYHMCEFLPIVNILELRRVSSMFIKIPVVSIFRRRLIQRIMDICNVNIADAISLIARCATRGGVISGSIILQVLIGEKWKSDIDIYVNTRPKRFSKKDFLVSVLGLPRDMVFKEYRNPMYPPVDDDNDEKSSSTVNTRGCEMPPLSVKSDYCLLYNYVWQKIDHCSKYNNIQVIGMDRDLSFSHHRATVEHFDMSIVSNSFFKNTLEIWNLDALIVRKNVMLTLTTIKRINKYILRGFSEQCNYPIYRHESKYRILIIEMICKIPVTSVEKVVIDHYNKHK
jgi:hypothetical protein